MVYLYRSYMYHIPQLFSTNIILLCNHAKTQTHINTQIATSACRQLLLQIQPIPFCCHNAFKSFINHPILRIRHVLTKTVRTYSYLIHEGSDHQNFAYDFESIEFSTWETNRKMMEAIKLSVLLFWGFFKSHNLGMIIWQFLLHLFQSIKFSPFYFLFSETFRKISNQFTFRQSKCSFTTTVSLTLTILK